MGIRSDFAFYTCPDGSLSGQRSPDVAPGNSLMYSAERFIAFKQNNVALGDDQFVMNRIAFDRRIGEGLYARTPRGKPFTSDQEEPDDYYGLLAVSPILAREIFENGKRRKFKPVLFKKMPWLTIPLPYYFPTGNQVDASDANAWFGRFPGFVAHLRICANAMKWPWHSAAWCYSIAVGPKTGDQDSWIITWIMIWANQRPNFFERQAVKIWNARMAVTWPGGIKSVFALYFKDPSHPLAVWTRS